MQIILIIVFVILIILGVLSTRTGCFSTVKIKEKEMGPFKLVFKEHIGPYKGTGKIQNEIYNMLIKENIETYKGFGIYYDDPKNTPHNELRSKSGCILEEKDYDKISQLKEKFNLMEIRKQRFVYTEFPFKLRLAIIIGIFKVYPKIDKYLKVNGYKKEEVMEIYDIPNNKILYLMPIR